MNKRQAMHRSVCIAIYLEDLLDSFPSAKFEQKVVSILATPTALLPDSLKVFACFWLLFWWLKWFVFRQKLLVALSFALVYSKSIELPGRRSFHCAKESQKTHSSNHDHPKRASRVRFFFDAFSSKLVIALYGVDRPTSHYFVWRLQWLKVCY